MKCAWQAYLNLLPFWMRSQVDSLGSDELQELRLRIGRPPELVLRDGAKFLDRNICGEDLTYCVNAASQYSPCSYATIAYGYITAAGGHRIGICGDIAIVNGNVSTVKNLTSLCIRVARDFPGIARQASILKGSILLIGSPGRGKTTLLRDLVRQKSNNGNCAVAVVDERRELFPVAGGGFCFSPGLRTEVISGCSKSSGIDMMIRTMNPGWIAVDEITAEEDCRAIIRAAWCGVFLLATAHADSLQDFLKRPVYRPLIQRRIFENIIVMRHDKSWVLERMNI